MGLMNGIGRFIGHAIQRLAPGMAIAIGGRAVPPERKLEEFLKGYTYWSYACARVISETVAAAPWRLYALQRDGTEKEVTDHIAYDLLGQFNPWMTSFDVRELTQLHQELAGEAFWGLEFNGLNKPGEIWPLLPQYTELLPGERQGGRMEFIAGLRYKVPGFPDITYQADEFVQFKFSHPTNLYRGWAPARAAALPLDIHQYASEYVRNFFFNDATPGGVLSTDQPLTEPQAQFLLKQWNQGHKGRSKAHMTAVLGQGTKYQKVDNNFQELALTDEMRRLRDDILGIWGVPKSVLGISDDVNRANAEAAQFAFAQWVVKPRLRRNEERINEFLLTRHYDKRLRLHYADPVPENRELNRQEAEGGLAKGILMLDEARRRLGETELPNGAGKVFYVPTSAIPTKPEDLVFSLEAAPATPPNDTEPKKGAHKAARPKIKDIDPATRWQNWIHLTAPHERRLSAALKKFFQWQQDGVMSRLKALEAKGVRKEDGEGKIDPEALLWDSEEAKTELGRRVNGPLRQALIDAAESAIAELGVDIAFDVEHPAVRTGLKDQLQHIRQIDDTTRDQLRAELLEGIEAGESIPQLADRVSKVFAHAKGYRAQTIARTEVNGAANMGSVEAWSQSGVVVKKEWIGAQDERSRGSEGNPSSFDHYHDFPAGANGETVPLGGLFKGTGEPMRFPGDPMGSAGNVIQCRCTVAPVTAADDDEDE